MKGIKILGISLSTLGLFFGPFALFSSSVIAENKDNKLKNTLLDRLSPTAIHRSARATIQESRRLELNLKDAINLTLENNRDLKRAYLQRIIDRENLAENTAIYIPQLTPTIGLTDSGNISLRSEVDFLVPTGGNFSVDWRGNGGLENINGNSLSQNFRVTFNQPLLRGFGPTITNIPIVESDRREDINILTLKTELIRIVRETISAYRNLVQAQESLKIAQQALDRAKEQLARNLALIEAGRLARVEIIQTQNQIANQEFNLFQAENTLKDARSRLIEILDIDRNLEIIATETPETEDIALDREELLELAFANNPSYLTALSNLEIQRLGLLKTKDATGWDLGLNLAYENNSGNLNPDIGNSDASASLNLTRNFFGNRQLERNLIRDRVELERSLISLAEIKEELTINVENNIRQVNFALEQTKRARIAKELALQQLENERARQRLGVGNLFQLIEFEERLVTAQNRELNEIINYLNSLTTLRQTLGITLNFWGIELEELPIPESLNSPQR